MEQGRKDMLQSAGTIVAIVISMIAMVTSIYEANIMKEQQKSMVWPYMSISTGYSNKGFSINALNNGTGPAIIKSAEITVDGKPVEGMLDLIKTLNPESKIGYGILKANKFNNYVFRSGQQIEILGLPWNEETRSLSKLIHEKVRIVICYESVLGDSWIYDSKDDSHKSGKFKAKVEFE